MWWLVVLTLISQTYADSFNIKPFLQPSQTLQAPTIVAKTNNGYHYEPNYPEYPISQAPLNDFPENKPNGYSYNKPTTTKPLFDDIPINNGYNYNNPNKPVNDQPLGYQYPQPGNIPSINSDPEIIPINNPKPYSYPHPAGKPFSPFVYGPPTTSTTTQSPPLQDEPSPQYIPSRPIIPQQDPPSNSYIPPSIQQDYLPPQQDFQPSYLPPLQPPSPPYQDEYPSDTYLPPIIQQDPPPNNGYLPPNDVVTIDVPDYPYLPPSQQDDYPIKPLPPAGYLPPNNDIPINDGYLPPQSDEVPPRDDRKYLPPATTKGNSLQIQISNMSCVSTPTQRYFKTVMRTSRPLENEPVIENVPRDNCLLARSNSNFNINLNGLETMKKCGVKECNKAESNGRVSLCMNVRFPTIKGLKLPEDILLTLQCKTQDRIVSQVKYLGVSPKEIQGRAAQGAIATGGQPNNFNSNVLLLRKSAGSNEFSAPVRSGSAVYLGEEMLLKAHIKKTDGWKYSRLSDVSMHKVTIGDLATKQSVDLIDARGCRDVRMRGVCPKQQAQDPRNPLVTTLPLRAFIFQGMNSGDSMLLSVRLIACLEYSDCYSDPWPCDDSSSRKHRGRRNTSHNKTTDWESQLQFTVILPDDNAVRTIFPRSNITVTENATRHIRWIPFTVIAVIFSFISMIVILFAKTDKHLRN